MIAIDTLPAALIYLVSFLIVFSETGVFFLFFLPGDSLLFALGLLANEGAIRLWYVMPLLIVASIVGNILAYYLGTLARAGLEQGRWFSRVSHAHLDRARAFYDRHGMVAILLARFVPVIRTFVPFFAGIVSMNRRTFMFWTVTGGMLWISIVTSIGYFFGKEFNLQNVAFLGTGMLITAVVATPVFIVLINRFLRRSSQTATSQK